MFVQEFVRIDVPLSFAVGAFEKTVLPRFGELVGQAWAQSGQPAPEDGVPVVFGARRDRVDGVAYAISWPAVGTCPAIDADIEIAEVSPNESHLELAGQSAYPFVRPWSVEARRAHRQCMVAVDSLLRSVAVLIESSVKPVR